MKNKGKLISSIILSIILIVVGVLLIIKLTNPNSSETKGEIQVKIVEIDNTIIDEKTLSFEEGDSLISLLEGAYADLEVSNGMIMTIGTLTTPADWSTFISIKVNGVDSEVGVLEIELVDGMVVEFVNTELIW